MSDDVDVIAGKIFSPDEGPRDATIVRTVEDGKIVFEAVDVVLRNGETLAFEHTMRLDA